MIEIKVTTWGDVLKLGVVFGLAAALGDAISFLVSEWLLKLV